MSFLWVRNTKGMRDLGISLACAFFMIVVVVAVVEGIKVTLLFTSVLRKGISLHQE